MSRKNTPTAARNHANPRHISNKGTTTKGNQNQTQPTPASLGDQPQQAQAEIHQEIKTQLPGQRHRQYLQGKHDLLYKIQVPDHQPQGST